MGLCILLRRSNMKWRKRTRMETEKLSGLSKTESLTFPITDLFADYTSPGKNLTTAVSNGHILYIQTHNTAKGSIFFKYPECGQSLETVINCWSTRLESLDQLNLQTAGNRRDSKRRKTSEKGSPETNLRSNMLISCPTIFQEKVGGRVKSGLQGGQLLHADFATPREKPLSVGANCLPKFLQVDYEILLLQGNYTPPSSHRSHASK